MARSRLGKGIDALLQGKDLEHLSSISSIVMVPVDQITANPNQPRRTFPEDTLKELSRSIAEKGILQPILAEDRGDGSYTIIAGERRYRAAKMAGLTEVPVIAQEFSDDEKLEIALIENLQREDLNPIDEAHAIQAAIEITGSTQDQLAKRLGKSRSALANTLRLLRLEDEIQRDLIDGTITAGHARALLSIDDHKARMEAHRQIRRGGLTVRESEAVSREPGVTGGSAVSASKAPGTEPSRKAGGANVESVELRQIIEHLVERLGTKVVIHGNESSGRIELTYYSTDDLERLIALISGSLPE